MKYQRSLPYFSALLKANSNMRMSILQSFPKFVVDDIIEVMYNVVLGKVKIGSRALNLKRHKKALVEMVNETSKKGRRNIIFNQKGGFLGALLPLVMGLVGPLINSFT